MAKKSKSTPAPAPAPAKAAKPKLPALVPFMPDAKAITANAGITALRMLAQAAMNRQQINKLQEEVESLVGPGNSHRGKAQVGLAMAVYAGGQVDPVLRADLPKVWSDSKRDLNYIYARVKMATGLTKADGSDVEEARTILSEQPGDSAEDIKRKASIRTNFQTMLNKATKVALHALDNGIVLSVDKGTGLLRLTDGKKGDAVKKHFGETSVILNENQNIKVKQGKAEVEKKLKVKPSFTEVMREAGVSHGVKVIPRQDSRTKTVSLAEQIVRVAEDLVKTLEKAPTAVLANDNVSKALKALFNAIEKVTG